jgi:DNA-binding PadR family transcriptional regulator
MSLEKDEHRWMKSGRQRSAVAQALRKPMTATEILAAARQVNPRIQLRDIWFLMRQFGKRGLVTCLNSKSVTGKVYFFTARGQKAVADAFGKRLTRPVRGVDWQRYGWVVRGRIRREVLIELGRSWAAEGATASGIRRRLRDRHLVGLNPTLRALKELVQAGFVAAQGCNPARRSKLYRLTKSGRLCVEQLLK